MSGVQNGSISSVLSNMRLVHSAALERVILDEVAGRVSLGVNINVATVMNLSTLSESRLHQGSVRGHVEVSLLKVSLTVGIVYLFASFS